MARELRKCVPASPLWERCYRDSLLVREIAVEPLAQPEKNYFFLLNRSIAVTISVRASAASVQPSTFTYLPDSRSL